MRKLMEMVQSGTIDAEVALEQIKESGRYELTIATKLGTGSRASGFL